MRNPLRGRGRPEKLTPQEQQEALELYREIGSIKAVARHFGVSDSTVRRILRKAEEPLRVTKTPRLISEEVEREILEHHHAGLTRAEIADLVGWSESAITKILRRAGIVRKRGRPRKQLPAEREAEIVALYSEQEMSIDELAALFGVGPAVISKILDRHGIERHPPGWRRYRFTEKEEHEIFEMALAGMTRDEIAAAVDAPYSTIRKVIARQKARRNPAFDAPIGLLAAASIATLAFGVWGWLRRRQPPAAYAVSAE